MSVATDIAPLVYARIVFGALILVEVCRFAYYGWIARYYIEPTFFFSYPGFGWVKPLPGIGMYAVFAATGVCAVLVALGACYRAAAVGLALGLTYVFLIDQTNFQNHTYLMCLVAWLLACVPAANAGSVDAWRRGHADAYVPAWCVYLLVGQIAIVYVFGAIAKLDTDWLSGAPAGVFLHRKELTQPLADSELARKAFAILGMLFDLLIVPALLWRRTRLLATVAAVMFHATNAWLFQIGVFPWMMLALTPLFWPAAWTRRILARPRILPPERRGTPPVFVMRRWGTWALTVYVAIQLLAPLRHWAYGGEVNWHERGHTFSWHMKLRTKRSKAQLVARDPVTGETRRIRLRDYLTRRQIKKMSTRPELIRQLAHEVARRLRAEGWSDDVEVRAVVRASLNGRPMQLLVDPEVNLAAVPRSFWRADWILPLADSSGAREDPDPEASDPG